MKRMQTTIVPAVLMLALLAATVYAQSDTQPATQPDQQGQMMNDCMMMGKMDNKMMGMSPEQCKQRCKDMGMTDQDMARCRIVMDMSVRATDPQAILANQAQLDLTPEQSQQIERIAEQARQQAQAVLTDAQRQQISEIGDEPTGMKQMHQRMMKRMQDRMKQTGGQGQQTCPMSMMMHGMSQNASAAAQPGGAAICCPVTQ
jgi:hypothetical protein